MFNGIFEWLRNMGTPGGFSVNPSGQLDMPRPGAPVDDPNRWRDALMMLGQSGAQARPQFAPLPAAPPVRAPTPATPLHPMFMQQAQQRQFMPPQGLAAFLSNPQFGRVFTPSDERLKEDIKTVRWSDGVRWVSYRMKDDPTRARQYGVIAQEVQKIKPDAVSTLENGYLGVDYAAIRGI